MNPLIEDVFGIVSPHQQRENIAQFLEHYCTQAADPQYAVMLKGPWGSGKTWFVDQLRKRLEGQGLRFLYITLYGVRNAEDIAEQCHRQMHPLLHNEVVKYTLGFARSALKGSIKLTFPGVETAAEISPGQSSRNVKVKGYILVFDDLERCTMELNEILGVINQFVEHDRARVLVLANTDQLGAAARSIPFETMKEKVIGRVFTIMPDAAGALQVFLMELEADCAKVLRPRCGAILRIFQKAGYHNLRQLRQALLDFSDLWHCIRGLVPNGDETRSFWDHLVTDIVTLSIERRAGAIDRTALLEIQRRCTDPSAKLDYSNYGPGGWYSRVALHGIVDGTQYALPAAAYILFFDQGFLSGPEARSALSCSPYLLGENSADWVRLWHWERLPESSFQEILDRALTRYKDASLSTSDELMHLTGLFFFFEERGVLSVDNLKELARNVVDRLHAGKRLQANCIMPLQPPPRSGLLPVWAEETQAFKEFLSYFEHARQQAGSEELQREAQQWLDEFDEDIGVWASRINPAGGEESYLAHFPIFAYIDAKLLAKKIAHADMPTLAVVHAALSSRYLLCGSDFSQAGREQHCFLVTESEVKQILVQQESESWASLGRAPRNLAHRYLWRTMLPLLSKVSQTIEIRAR